MSAFVYMLASRYNGTLYIGVTTDLQRRVADHKSGAVPGFTKRYGVKMLVYFEEHYDVRDAILRETQMKRWRRDWKKQLIEKDNPRWRDLAEDWFRSSERLGETIEIAPGTAARPTTISHSRESGNPCAARESGFPLSRE